ncbi:MAG TPA: aspartate-semialdehyde dehydrogenase [Candidatus Limnocylindrales bacterium]|nr:aspartate-semialdehyde dehydrogenase [Candidatus Limnocylindrales bacterium]
MATDVAAARAGRRAVPDPVVAVVGATGLVGQTMLEVLAERRIPVRAIRALASARSAGTSLTVAGRTLRVEEATPTSFDGIDIALFSAGTDQSRLLAPAAVAAGCVVVDNSAAWRMDPTVPLVVSRVNEPDLEAHRGIVANPNCSTMQLVPLLATLRDAVGLRRVIVDTYQSVSGTGSEAVEELEDQVRAHAAGEPKRASVYPHPIAFNAIPEIDVFRPDGYTAEEWKVVAESRKILHLPELAVSCTAVRVPVFVGHSEAVHVETERPIGPAAARELFAATPGVAVVDDPAAHRYPLATDMAGRDDVAVGRIRADASLPDGHGLAFWVVADNLRRGAASNTVDLAEALVARGLLLGGR